MALRYCDSLGLGLTLESLDDGTLCRACTPLPCVAGFHLLPGGLQLRSEFLKYSPAEYVQHLEDEHEFKVLTHKVRVVKASGVKFKGLDDYVAYRTKYFGSAREYKDIAAQSDKELRESKLTSRKGKIITLRSRLDEKFQGKDMDEAANYFYRWVRQQYLLEFGGDKGFTGVPAFIFRGRSDKLDEALKGVKFRDAQYGGFNPRPIKAKIKKDAYYKLGTLSDHADGLAIDIEAQDNPQISISAWAFIEKFTKKSSSVQWREAQWISAPGVLWQYVQDLSDSFAAKCGKQEALLREQEEKQREEEKKKAAGGGPTGTAKVAPAGAPAPKAASQHDQERFKRKILGDYYKELNEYTGGFFTLEKDLVEALREHGLTWGATFGLHSAIDLMHFELRMTPLPHWPAQSKQQPSKIP